MFRACLECVQTAASSEAVHCGRLRGLPPTVAPGGPPCVPRSGQASFASYKWQPEFRVESESLPLALLQHSSLSEWGFGMSENRRGEGRCVCDCECLYVRAARSVSTSGSGLPQTASCSCTLGSLFMGFFFCRCCLFVCFLKLFSLNLSLQFQTLTAQRNQAQRRQHDFQRECVSPSG